MNHAIDVFNNKEVYSTIRTKFIEQGKYTRMIGNHDNLWDDESINSIFQLNYPNTIVNHFCTLEDPDTKETKFVIAHGHQTDVFNMDLCSLTGRDITKLASSIHNIS